MNQVVNSFFEYGFNIGKLYLSLLPIAPFVVIIFLLVFSINKLREFINDYNHIFDDEDGDDQYSKMNRYYYFRHKYDI